MKDTTLEMFCNYLEMSGLGQIYNSAFNSSKHRDDFFNEVGPIDWLNDMPLTSLTNLECTKVIYAKAAWLELVCANVWAVEDNVNHPSHYTSHPSGVEVIQITEHMGFCLGNAIKYILRCDEKHDAIEDLKKAVWYLEREIAKREG